MTDIAEPTRMMPGCHTLRDARGVVLIQGEYDPQHMFAILSAGDPAYWRGKRVLDVGANTCGLSVEIARAGAAEVIALEPDAYTNSLVDVEDVLRRLKEEENLLGKHARRHQWRGHHIDGLAPDSRALRTYDQMGRLRQCRVVDRSNDQPQQYAALMAQPHQLGVLQGD